MTGDWEHEPIELRRVRIIRRHRRDWVGLMMTISFSGGMLVGLQLDAIGLHGAWVGLAVLVGGTGFWLSNRLY